MLYFLARNFVKPFMREAICHSVEKLDWAEARHYAANGCQELFEILEEISPDQHYPLIRVIYPFGNLIMQDDALYVPIEGSDSIPLTDPRVPKKLQDALGYRSIPFGMITKNPIEVYRETNDRVFSVELSGPNKGIELGIFEYFKLTPCYSVSSGARSLFMLPKISEARNHKRLLKTYHLNSVAPKSIFKHWHIFKGLYNSALFQTQWDSEIIYLTKEWDEGLKKHQKSLAWAKLIN